MDRNVSPAVLLVLLAPLVLAACGERGGGGETASGDRTMESGAGAAAGAAGAPDSDGKAERTVRTVDLRGSPLHIVLAPDDIPSIDDPRFVRAAVADFLEDDEPILGVFDGRVAKAYSLWHLDHHEIVNDTLGDEPIAATW